MPISATFPWSKTAIWSVTDSKNTELVKSYPPQVVRVKSWLHRNRYSPAFLIVDRRCAIVRTVLPFMIFSSASCTKCSLSASSALKMRKIVFLNPYLQRSDDNCNQTVKKVKNGSEVQETIFTNEFFSKPPSKPRKIFASIMKNGHIFNFKPFFKL